MNAAGPSTGYGLDVPQATGLSAWGGYVASPCPDRARPGAGVGTAGCLAAARAGDPVTFTSAEATWVVPKVRCVSRKNVYAPWVGIDGDPPSATVEQTGVETTCASGKPVHRAWWEMFPANPVYYDDPISTGDTITASVVASGATFTLTIEDVTQGWTETVKRTSKSAMKFSAEAVIEAPGPGGYPDIDAVQFTDVRFNGKPLASFDPSKSRSGDRARAVYVPSAISHRTDFALRQR
jgi:hypothetical protein